MALCYKISPELNMILYVGVGHSTPSDFFALERAAFLRYPRQLGMITLVDALDLSTSFELDDIHHFIENIERMAKNGMEPGPYVMLTRDWGLHLLAEAAKLMAGNVDLRARMYFTIQESILGLGLSDHTQEIIQLWDECKLGSSRTSRAAANIRSLNQAT